MVSSCIRRSLGQAQGAYREALAGVPWAGEQGCEAQGPHFPGLPLVVRRCEHCRGSERLVLSWTHREPTTDTEVQANAVSSVGLLNCPLAPSGGTMVYHQ